MTQTIVKLTDVNSKSELFSNHGKAQVIYAIGHNNGTSTLDCALILNRHENGQWTAKIDFGEFPEFETPNGAAGKLADWMKRAAESIKNHDDFSLVNLEDI